ncbi:MAG: DUF541 domain-containing protein [Pedobacter sp.]|nr:MAG: DUF541 domain-containing protein [Pedobacter sp.]
MKRLFAIALVALFSLNATAQQVDLRKKITVSGTAETEVTPDIIYINISLKEYLKDGNSKKKVDITTLETQLFNAVQKAGIAKENLTINNLSSWNYQTTKKKDPDFLASKQYRLKVSDLNKFNLILEAIDAKGIASTNIESFDYSKIEVLKKELKVKALLAAKEKATYMVEALGDKLGNVLDIQDLGDNGGLMVPQYRNYAMKAEMAMDASQAPEIDFKKIKLSFTVNTVFEIK